MNKLRIFYSMTIMLLSFSLFTGSANANVCQVLLAVHHHVESTIAQGDIPVVIFDLDDTLIDTRQRNLRIINDFINGEDISIRFPLEVEKLKSLLLSDIRYNLADTLKVKGVVDEGFVKEISSFWLTNFFSNQYSATDKPNPGAAKYVRKLQLAGAIIVYLTGRDVPRMREGTIANLKKLGFPLDNNAVLMMKPIATMDDLAFKKEALQTISKLGKVVGAFENEPANINLLHSSYPEAISVFLDTIHSPKPIEPDAGIEWVKNFMLCDELVKTTSELQLLFNN